MVYAFAAGSYDGDYGTAFNVLPYAVSLYWRLLKLYLKAAPRKASRAFSIAQFRLECRHILMVITGCCFRLLGCAKPQMAYHGVSLYFTPRRRARALHAPAGDITPLHAADFSCRADASKESISRRRTLAERFVDTDGLLDARKTLDFRSLLALILLRVWLCRFAITLFMIMLSGALLAAALYVARKERILVMPHAHGASGAILVDLRGFAADVKACSTVETIRYS